jgi:hypothetical protein
LLFDSVGKQVRKAPAIKPLTTEGS